MKDELNLDMWEVIKEKREIELREKELRREELFEKINYHARNLLVCAFIGSVIAVIVRILV